MRKKLHQDIYIAILIYLFAFTMFFLGRNIRSADSKLYPFICLGLMVALNTILLVNGILKSRKLTAEELAAANTVRWDEIRKPLLIFLGIIAYVIIFDFFGYFIATALMMLGFMWVLGVRDWKVLIFVPGVLLALIYLFFVMKLHVPLM